METGDVVVGSRSGGLGAEPPGLYVEPDADIVGAEEPVRVILVVGRVLGDVFSSTKKDVMVVMWVAMTYPGEVYAEAKVGNVDESTIVIL